MESYYIYYPIYCLFVAQVSSLKQSYVDKCVVIYMTKVNKILPSTSCLLLGTFNIELVNIGRYLSNRECANQST